MQIFPVTDNSQIFVLCSVSMKVCLPSCQHFDFYLEKQPIV